MTEQTASQGRAHPFDKPLAFLGEKLRVDYPLAGLCTYRVGGSAARFVLVRNESELTQIAAALAQVELVAQASSNAENSVYVVGRGSNLLVADAGFQGLVLQLGDTFGEVQIADSINSLGLSDKQEDSAHPAELGELANSSAPRQSFIVRAGSIASLPVVARKTVAASLTGFEWAVGVPGSIGGAVRMNAGGHGADMADSLQRVRVLDLMSGENSWVTTASLDLGYRHSNLTSTQVVLQAELLLEVGDRALGEQRLSEIVSWRREHQPGGQNAGSVFRNPAGDSAGRLIEAAGCRGLRLGTAQVSMKHANFIQADAQGSADDVLRLMLQVAQSVREHSGLQLQAETVLLGFAPQSDQSQSGEYL
ncbi:MAG: FAD-binding protein [Microthrixaceae bacterium]